MRINPRKLSSRSVAVLLAAFVLGHSGTTDAQSTSRSFQTGLYIDLSEPALTKADADIAMFGEGQPQPPGRSIMKFKSYSYATPILAAEGYDWSRIVAALIDEPYLVALHDAFGGNQNSNPCGTAGPRMDVITRTGQQLAAAASALRSVAPWTRLWVNFNVDSEVQWMMNGQCPLNQPYIDVISLDAYYRPFYNPNPNNGLDYVKRYYDWIVANRATPQQQLALIPGTFLDGTDIPPVQAGFIPGYFDYANSSNQSCNLPLGPRGVTGSFDGCLVWMVLGFAADTFTENGRTYVGELDPSATQISNIWRPEVALPIRSGLSYERTRKQIVTTLMRQWLSN